jgi:hypothetical protein
MTTWKEFWNQDNSVYVSERHMRSHFTAVARDILTILPKKRPLALLDWGCGEALEAGAFVDEGITLLLHDPVPRTHRRISERFKGNPRITVLTEDGVAALPEGSVDVILINSVLQYVPKEDFAGRLPLFHRLLSKEGALILADIVPVESSIFQDVFELLKAGWQNGFLIDAAVGMARTFFSSYRSIRKTEGFSAYSEPEILSLLNEHGFAGKRMDNAGFSTHRMLVWASRI